MWGPGRGGEGGGGRGEKGSSGKLIKVCGSIYLKISILSPWLT